MKTEHKHFTMGRAPYRFIGVWSAPSSSVAEHNPNAYNQMMASRPAGCGFMCDHCGTSIMHHYMLQDADGKRFAVGSECVRKIDDVENIDDATAAKKEQDRAARKVRSDKKREERNAAREAKLQAERDNNGGLTNWEYEKQQREAAQAKHLERTATKRAYFIDRLEPGYTFEGSLREQLENGHFPQGRGVAIMLSIIAKKSGRANSKAYKTAYEEAENNLIILLNKMAGA